MVVIVVDSGSLPLAAFASMPVPGEALAAAVPMGAAVRGTFPEWAAEEPQPTAASRTATPARSQVTRFARQGLNSSTFGDVLV